jgi:phenylacetate-coenzyme A ligase PaaK-like adenylate-forming protein
MKAAITAEDVSEFSLTLAKGLATSQRDFLDPPDLASLFRHTYYHFSPDGPSENPYSETLRNTLQRFLLQRTIAHARIQTDFYRGYAAADFDVEKSGDPPDLGRWPILTREAILENPNAFIARDVHFASISHTSGSTGTPVNIVRSKEEVEYIYYYYKSLFATQRRDLGPTPLALSFPTVYHGTPLQVPTRAQVFLGGVTDDTLIADTINTLATTYNIPGHDERISILSGMLLHVHLFTSVLIEQGYTPSQFGVRSLILGGAYISKMVWNLLSTSWNAAVFDRFSLTESVGGATHCWRCGSFHLDPHVIGEVVDVDSGESLGSGVGRLTLTQLYPFVQMQPLIRYNTGDIVRKVHRECNSSFTFDFLGKEKNCITWNQHGKTEWLIFSADIYEILNELPDVNRKNWCKNLTLARDHSVGSKPLYQVRVSGPPAEPLRLDIDVELRYAPHCYPDHVADLRKTLINRLRAVNDFFARGMDEDLFACEVRFLSPSALQEDSGKKV